MDFVQLLPIEILEEIFTYLSSRDLINCSQVSKQWRFVSNSNKLWAGKCLMEKIHDKVFLEVSTSAIKNPAKKFRADRIRPVESLSPCRWRSHYDRYKFLERNWRGGYCGIHSLKIIPMHYSDGVIIGKRISNLDLIRSDLGANRLESRSGGYWLYDMSQFKYTNLCSIPGRIDNVIFKNGCLIYSHNHEITCQKLDQSKEFFVKEYTLELQDNANFIETHSSPTLRLFCSNRYLLVHNSVNPYILRLYDSKTGAFKKEKDLKHLIGHRCYHFTCEDVFGDKLYARYDTDEKWFILVYDYVADQLTAKIEVPGEPTIVATKNFFYGKINQSQFDLASELKVWSSHTGAEIAVYCTDKTFKPIFTSDDKIIYFEGNKISIRGLLRHFERDIIVPNRVIKMCQVRDQILVCELLCSIQLWDIASGQRLYVLYRHSFLDMWVDDRAIVLKDSSMTSSKACAFW